jgi:HAMP domain-containing protein
VKSLLPTVTSAFLLVGLVALWVASRSVEQRHQDELRSLARRLNEVSARGEAAVEIQRLTLGARDNLEGRTLVAAAAPVFVASNAAAPGAEEPKGAAPAAFRTREELQDSAEAQFVGEAFDRNWSSDAAAQLQSKLTPWLRRESRLRSLECRESLCRLETSHRDLQEFQDFQRDSLSAHDFGWQGPMLFAPLKTEKSGEVTAVTYLTRPGRTPDYMKAEGE